MRRDPLLGRTLWPALLVLLLGYVVADFVHYPFVASTGSAAVPAPQITLWVLGTEAGNGAETLARGTAAGLDLHGHPTAVKTLAGGSSQAVASFLAGRDPEAGGAANGRPAPGAQLLVLTSATLADLARDRREQLVPGAAERAALAQELLRRAAPIALLAGDPLELAVARGSRIRDTAQLVAAMRAQPEARLFAIADDTFSRVELAALVDGAGVNGRARFSAFPTGPQAALALELGDANTVLATRGALHDDVRAGRVRPLAWPLAGAGAGPPRAWFALVAPPDTSAPRAAALRRAVAELTRDPRWRALLRAEGRTPPPATTAPGARLGAFLASQSRAAAALQVLSEAVERR